MHVSYTHLAMYLSSLVNTMLATTATLGNFFKQFEKVAKHWQPLTMMATYRQRTGDHWRRRAMWWQSPASIGCVASTVSASVNGALPN